MKTTSNSTFSATFDNFNVDWNLGLRHSKRGYIKLQPKELSVLIELVSNSGQLITKDHLIAKIWNDQSISDSSIARCISSIKSQLNIASPGAELLIRSVYGEGYIFAGEVKTNTNLLTEDSFFCLINQSPDLIACKDGDGHLIALNDQAIRTFGLEGNDWLGKRGTELTELVRQSNRDVFYTYFASDDDAWSKKTPSKCLASISFEGGNAGTLEIIKTPAFHYHITEGQLSFTSHG